MFTRSEGQSAFDSVICVGAAIVQPPTGEAPDVQLTMVYVQKETGTTFGTCPVQAHLLSPRTIQLAKELMASAEQDFGELVFGEGAVSELGGQPSGLGAESTERKGLGWKG